MKRRTILQSLAALPAVDLLRAQQPAVPPKPTPAAVEQIPVIEATVPDVAASTVARYFSPDQFAALQHFADLMAPSFDGMPGALDAHAPEFLDFLTSQESETKQSLYREGLDELNRKAAEHFKVTFAATSEEQAARILAPLHEPWTRTAPDQFTTFLRAAKEDTLKATENSREWIKVMSKRVRSAGGIGTYWYPID